jgi:DNA-binding transcriptional regulator YiaG
MARADELLKDMIRFHGKRIAKEVVGDLPDQMKQARRDIRSIEKALEKLTKQVEGLVKQGQPEPSIPAIPEDQLKGARLTKRTLPSVRKRFELTQGELARLLEVSALTVSSWENGKSRPRAASVAQIIALRSMSQEQVDAALGRQAVSAAMSAEQIKELRGKLGMSQGELAKLLGVSAAAVGQWEQGRSAPGASNRASLAQAKAMTQEKMYKRLGRTRPHTAGTGSVAQTTPSPEQIRNIRKEAGLSQAQLAKELGISVNSVSNWETGSTSPRANNLEKLLAMTK